MKITDEIALKAWENLSWSGGGPTTGDIRIMLEAVLPDIEKAIREEYAQKVDEFANNDALMFTKHEMAVEIAAALRTSAAADPHPQ